MSFKSVNELNQFIYDDSQITSAKYENNRLCFELEALIVGTRNSQNSNYTESYADTATMELTGAHIEEMLIEGYKLYDADDKLVEEVEDTIIAESEYASAVKLLKEGFLFSVDCIRKSEDENTYSFEIDMDTVDERGISNPYSVTYQIKVTFKQAVVSWERYLNRVQK